MDFTRINGVLLHHASVGDAGAPPVVLLNSLGTDFRIWDGVAARLCERFRVLRYDMRGHGLSDAPPGPYAIGTLANDLLGFLDALGIERAAVVGLSVGGLVAQEIAARDTGRVPALVLMDTAARIGTAESWNARIAAVEAGGLAAIGEAVTRLWFGAEFRQTRADEAAGFRLMLERTPVAGYLGTCAAIRDADLTADLSRLDAPTLVIAGSEDGSTPPALVRATAERIRGARFELIEGAGHLPCVEAPDRIAALIGDHLRGNGHG